MATVNIPQQYQTLKTRLETIVKKIISPKLINANDDLNDYRETGLYYCNLSHNDILTISNCPVSDGFTLFVQEDYCYTGGVKQVVTHHQSSATYMRVIYTDFNDNFYSSGWKPLWEDTGWKDVTFSSGFVHHSETDRVRYRRVGKVVELRGAVKNTNQVSANTDVTVATIGDTTCRPSKRVTYRQQGSGMNTFVISINTTGTIAVNRYGTTSGIAIPSGSWLNVHTTFLVD